jgi:hypothetical protein
VPVGSVADTITGQAVQAPDDFLIVRSNPATGTPERLGMVGRDYKVVQNEEVADFLQALVDESGAIFHTGGSLQRGSVGVRHHEAARPSDGRRNRRVRLLHRRVLPPRRLGILHHGRDSRTGRLWNTERAALRNHRSIFKVRHTGHIAGRIAEAREALKLTWKHGQAFAAEAEQLLAVPMEVKEFRQFTGALLPLPAVGGDCTHDEINGLLDILQRETDSPHVLNLIFWPEHEVTGRKHLTSEEVVDIACSYRPFAL